MGPEPCGGTSAFLCFGRLPRGLGPANRWPERGGVADTDTNTGSGVRVGPPKRGGLDRFFKITERGSTVRIEIIAGITSGRWREVHPLLYVVAAIFAWYFVHGVV